MDGADQFDVETPALTEVPTVRAELEVATAARDIAEAASARHTIARRYVTRVRRRHPEATPEEIIRLLERHYVVAISVAGGLTTAAAIAASVGLSLLPGGGPGAHASRKGAQAAAKKLAAKAAAKAAAKQAAANMMQTGVSRMVPAGDARIQFEVTGIFALAVAAIHGMQLDKDQAVALVYGLSNEGVSQETITTMALDVAGASPAALAEDLTETRQDWSHWANTLAAQLPGTAAQELVQTVQTGQFDTMRAGFSARQQSVIEYGAGAVAGGMTRFAFGREVVAASRTAFSEPPSTFPPGLDIEMEPTPREEPNRAFVALDEAADATAAWMAGAADRVTRPFRSVDRDGDGVPDEPLAKAAIRGAGSALARVGSNVPRLRRKT